MTLDLQIRNQSLAAANTPLLDLKVTCNTTLDAAAAAASVTCDDTTGFSIGQVVLIGNFGEPQSEIIRIHTSTAVTATVITFASSTVYAHPSGTPITRIDWNQAEFSRAATLAGSKVVVGSLTGIMADNLNTTIVDLTNSTGYGFLRFYNSFTTTYSGYSTGTPYPQAAESSVVNIALEACSLTGQELYGEYTQADQLSRDLSEAQRMVSKGRDWVFELSEDETIPLVQGENTYDLSSISPTLKYPLNYQGFISVKIGNRALTYLDPEDMDAVYMWVKSGELSVATTVGVTTVTLVNSSSFPDQGTVDIGESIGVSYTANDKVTGILSGIPASGDGSVTSIEPIGRSVFFGLAQSNPVSYTVYNGDLKLNCPVNEQSAGIDFKFRFLRRLPQITSLQDTTLIPFFEDLSYFIASKIERRKRNYADADGFLAEFVNRLSANASIYELPQTQNYFRYNIMSNSNRFDNLFGPGWDNWS